MFIIDFDDTLFDTHAFKLVRQKVLKNLGVSDEVYKKSYHEAYNNSFGVNTYNNNRHAEVLEKYGFDKRAVITALNELNTPAKGLLFPDAINLLEYLKKSNQKLILLSLGEANFQKIKIESVGIAKYFDEVYTVDDSKEHIIEKILKNYPANNQVWLINDKIEETEIIIQRFPEIKPILKMSPMFTEEEYRLTIMPYFSTLTEIQQYVEQQIK